MPNSIDKKVEKMLHFIFAVEFPHDFSMNEVKIDKGFSQGSVEH